MHSNPTNNNICYYRIIGWGIIPYAVRKNVTWLSLLMFTLCMRSHVYFYCTKCYSVFGVFGCLSSFFQHFIVFVMESPADSLVASSKWCMKLYKFVASFRTWNFFLRVNSFFQKWKVSACYLSTTEEKKRNTCVYIAKKWIVRCLKNVRVKNTTCLTETVCVHWIINGVQVDEDRGETLIL